MCFNPEPINKVVKVLPASIVKEPPTEAKEGKFAVVRLLNVLRPATARLAPTEVRAGNETEVRDGTLLPKEVRAKLPPTETKEGNDAVVKDLKPPFANVKGPPTETKEGKLIVTRPFVAPVVLLLTLNVEPTNVREGKSILVSRFAILLLQEKLPPTYAKDGMLMVAIEFEPNVIPPATAAKLGRLKLVNTGELEMFEEPPTAARVGKLTVVSLVKPLKTNESLMPTMSEEDRVVRLSIVGLL
jgi:hypothetical protein